MLQARARFEGETLTAIEARRLSDALGHDPLLLNLADLRRREPWEEGGSRPISLEVLDRFLENHYIRLAQQENARFAASDYKDALFELADWMLQEREMVPTWRRIRSWLGSSSGEWRALQHIVADRQIAHLLTEGGEEVLHFRHDRVRDAILAAALASQMKMGMLADVLLDEPFYAEFFGQALLAPGVDPAWVDRLCERNPLALFRALQLFETPRSPLQEAVITGLKAWLAKEVVTGRALDALQWEAVRFLAETDSPLVLELSRSFPETWHGVFEAQFRNGEVAAAVAYCAGMEMGVPYVGFVPLVEHVQIKFGAPFSRDLAAMLTQGSLSQRQLGGALFLAGHLGEPDLAAAVRSSWARATDHQMPLLAEFLWAALRCLPESDEEMNRLLDPLCEAWRTLSGESPDPSRAPENVELIRPLQDAFFWRGPDGRAVSALIRRASGTLHWPITVLLRYVDAPDAVEFTVRQAAARDYWGYTSAWEHWDFHGRRLGTSSTERLKALWRSPSEEAEVRRKAFHFWNIATQGLDFDVTDVQGIGPSAPFYREALKCRIETSDQTAVAELIHMTETAEHPHFWWQHAHRIWNEMLRNALDSFLGHLPDNGRAGDWEWEGYHFCAAGVLIEIPTADAEGLLVRNWEHLRYRRLFVQAALAIATPRCCELVAAVVSNCPEPRRLFEHFDFHCGLRTRGKGQRFGNRQLQAILPYLELFSANTIESFWQNCNEQGWLGYRRRYLDPRLTPEQRRRCRLEQAGLSEALDRFLVERLSPWSVDMEIERSQRGGESWPNILAGLLAWLQERRTLRALDIVAHALVWAGRRIDLPRPGEVGIAAEPNEIQQIIDRTTFQVSRRRLR
ncbi:MAG TPA: hypothetical protein VGR07_19380 [Thermoanaerobaculia bacterium]|nr:hypothetical protein [Thermoanaerobaculia bacterium]